MSGAADSVGRIVCADCPLVAPVAKVLQPLANARHGWRMRRLARDEGGWSLEWRCPDCWARWKPNNARVYAANRV